MLLLDSIVDADGLDECRDADVPCFILQVFVPSLIVPLFHRLRIYVSDRFECANFRRIFNIQNILVGTSRIKMDIATFPCFRWGGMEVLLKRLTIGISACVPYLCPYHQLFTQRCHTKIGRVNASQVKGTSDLVNVSVADSPSPRLCSTGCSRNLARASIRYP